MHPYCLKVGHQEVDTKLATNYDLNDNKGVIEEVGRTRLACSRLRAGGSGS